MALINCPECGKEVSDKAATCPNCGVAIKQGKLSSLLEKGKKHIPVIQETGQKYIKTMQETSKKHIDTVQKHIHDNQNPILEQKPTDEIQEPLPEQKPIETKPKESDLVVEVPKESVCYNCGASTTPNSKFCEKCGASLQTVDITAEQVNNQIVEQQSVEDSNESVSVHDTKERIHTSAPEYKTYYQGQEQSVLPQSEDSTEKQLKHKRFIKFIPLLAGVAYFMKMVHAPA